MGTTDEAIILAGGFGTRLRGVVDAVPKPLAPVTGRPFLAWMLDVLAAQGLRRVVLATGHLGDQVESTLGSTWRGMALAYSREPAPLGTGGALALALSAIEGDTLFALNGDTWLELDYTAFAHAAMDSGAPLGIALARVPDVGRYGAVHVDGERIVGFEEKGGAGAGYINAGVYWLRREVLAGFAPGHAFSFEREVLEPIASRAPVVGFTATRGFIDIGVPEDYLRAQAQFAAMPAGAR
ncbi:MAG: nucleotidyltransferase family protein [Proteobacteria bacterium]|nr:nucleotidyltransferase family protein [Pseudomonadota bacterium]